MLLPSFSILFDSLLSTAQSRFWFSSSTSLLSSTYSCLCGGSFRYSPLLGNLRLHLPLKSLSAIVKIPLILISSQRFSSWASIISSFCFFFLLFSLFCPFSMLFLHIPCPHAHLTYHRAEGDRNSFRPGEGVSSYFVTSSPGALPVVFIW